MVDFWRRWNWRAARFDRLVRARGTYIANLPVALPDSVVLKAAKFGRAVDRAGAALRAMYPPPLPEPGQQ